MLLISSSHIGPVLLLLKIYLFYFYTIIRVHGVWYLFRNISMEAVIGSSIPCWDDYLSASLYQTTYSAIYPSAYMHMHKRFHYIWRFNNIVLAAPCLACPGWMIINFSLQSDDILPRTGYVSVRWISESRYVSLNVEINGRKLNLASGLPACLTLWLICVGKIGQGLSNQFWIFLHPPEKWSRHSVQPFQ